MVPTSPWLQTGVWWLWCSDAHLALGTNRSMNDCGVLMPTSPWVQTGVGMNVMFWCPPRPGYKQEYEWLWCDDAHLALVTNRSGNECDVLMPTSPWLQTGVWMIVVFWMPPRPGYKQEYGWFWCDDAHLAPGYKQEYEWLWCSDAHLALVTNRSMNDCDVMVPTSPWLQTGVWMIVVWWCPPRPGYKQSMNDCDVMVPTSPWLQTGVGMNVMWWCPPCLGYKQE